MSAASQLSFNPKMLKQGVIKILWFNGTCWSRAHWLFTSKVRLFQKQISLKKLPIHTSWISGHPWRICPKSGNTDKSPEKMSDFLILALSSSTVINPFFFFFSAVRQCCSLAMASNTGPCDCSVVPSAAGVWRRMERKRRKLVGRDKGSLTKWTVTTIRR